METLIYLFKINIAVVVFCIVYKIFYCKDTFFSMRRYLLTGMLLLSVLYPLIDLSQWMIGSMAMKDLAVSYINMLPEVVVNAQDTTTPAGYALVPEFYLNLALWVYFFGVCLFLLRILFGTLQIIWLRLHSKQAIIEGVSVNKLDTRATPFSFFSWIFINPDIHDEKELLEITAHEMVHVNQRHSVDVIISEIVCALCWINPFVWIVKREIHKNLEFIVDASVINQAGIDMKSYQYHLLKLAYHPAKISLANRFNLSPLKERITMINAKRSPKVRIAAYTIIFPVLLLFLVINNIDAVAGRLKIEKATNSDVPFHVIPLTQTTALINDVQPQPETAKIAGSRLMEELKKQEAAKAKLKKNDNESIANEEFVFVTVEEMPEYPGGNEALLKWIAENINYPVTAAENGIEGRINCQFIVRKDGSVDDVKVLRSLDPNLDSEAIRVLSALPKFKPGKQQGRNVSVKFSVPVRFALKK